MHFGCSTSYTRRTLRAMGISYNKQRLDKKLQHNELIKYVEQNPEASLSGIAKHIDCDRAYIHRKLVELKIESNIQRRKPYQKIDRDKIIEYILNHPQKRVPEIARHFDCCVSTIYEILQRADIAHQG
jgi:DNA-binding IclR family transcriptional regulator